MSGNTIPPLTFSKGGVQLRVRAAPGSLRLEFSGADPRGKRDEVVICLTVARALKLAAAACGLRTGHTEALLEEYRDQSGTPQLPHWPITEDTPPKWLGFTSSNRPYHVCLTARGLTPANGHEGRSYSIPLGYTDLFALETWAYETTLAILHARRPSPTTPQRKTAGQSSTPPARQTFIGSQKTLAGKITTLPEEIRQAPGVPRGNGYTPKADG